MLIMGINVAMVSVYCDVTVQDPLFEEFKIDCLDFFFYYSVKGCSCNIKGFKNL